MAEQFPDDWPGIYSATMGAIFLGTPFRGAHELTLSQIIQAVGASKRPTIQGQILRILEPEDEMLLEIVHTFERILAKSSTRPVLACFFELKPCDLNVIVGNRGEKACIS
jgi:hypothetical protein